MKKKVLIFVGLLLSLGTKAQEVEVIATWNAQNVVLPSSQYTPAQRWKAQVMVFNTGQKYADAYYNKVWGTPPADAEGRAWYELDYVLTNGDKQWSEQTSPFSSDEKYMGQPSYRWIALDIMGDIYLRRSFKLTEMPARALFLTCGHDDAPSEFYLNGVLLHTVSDGWKNDEYVLLTDDQKALLKTDGSENILAVHVHQNYGGAYADCGLYEADMMSFLLPTLDGGPWPCAYYFLNSNAELNTVKTADWTGRCVNEDDWSQGYGPFSNSGDKFRTTEWGSERLPLLVRRHFTLTADVVQQLQNMTVQVLCSYDENPKVYLNETLLFQKTGYNDNEYASYTLTPRNKQMLKEGDNVLAVSLMAGEGGGHIDYGLCFLGTLTPTAISTVTRDALITPEQRVYNLKGQYVGNGRNALGKGIYIVNGKKVVIK